MMIDSVWIFCANVTLYVHVFVFLVLGISSKNLFNKPSECLLCDPDCKYFHALLSICRKGSMLKGSFGDSSYNWICCGLDLKLWFDHSLWHVSTDC